MSTATDLGPPLEFDLEAINHRLYTTRRPGRYLGLGVATGLTIVAIAITATRFVPIIHSLARHSPIGLVYLVVMASALASAALVGYLFFAFAPGPISLRLDKSELRIIYSQGRLRVLPWLDPDLRFKLLDFSAHESEMTDYGSAYFLELSRGQWIALSPVAFGSILRAVREHELATTSFLGFAGYGFPPVVRYVHQPGTRVRTWFRRPIPMTPG